MQGASGPEDPRHSAFLKGHGFTGYGKSHMPPAEAGSGQKLKGLIGTPEVMP
jgi:hypothetical protein